MKSVAICSHLMAGSSLVQVLAWWQTGNKPLPKSTRTTRMPAFWGYPLPPHDYPFYWVILSYWIPNEKKTKSKLQILKKNSKITNVWILKQTLHATHIVKLLDKMCKYEMDPTSIVEDTERTRFCPQTDRQGETSIPHFQLRWVQKFRIPYDNHVTGPEWVEDHLSLADIPDVHFMLSSRNHYLYRLVQERRNSIANALELRLSCTNP